MALTSRAIRFDASATILLSFIIGLSAVNAQDSQPAKKYAIVLHGGAGGDPSAWSEEYKKLRIDGLEAALAHGVQMLESSANAIDVVEQVVRLLEDNPIFNAGRGCVLNDQGEHELDASIMDGSNLRCGAVGSIRKAKHPVSVARKVMTDTKHILLIGEGADQFAIAAQCELAEADYFRTERQKSNWEMWKKKESSTSLYRPQMLPANDDEPLYLGTVGCVVVDRSGNLAAATSTGGLMGKRWGRVGDSPIIGAGNYADNATCAVSGTGVGEEFIRHTIASDVAARMRYADQSLQDATRAAVSQLPADCGGVIAVDAAGEIAIEFNTPGMSRAYANSAGVHAVKLGREE